MFLTSFNTPVTISHSLTTFSSRFVHISTPPAGASDSELANLFDFLRALPPRVPPDLCRELVCCARHFQGIHAIRRDDAIRVPCKGCPPPSPRSKFLLLFHIPGKDILGAANITFHYLESLGRSYLSEDIVIGGSPPSIPLPSLSDRRAELLSVLYSRTYSASQSSATYS